MGEGTFIKSSAMYSPDHLMIKFLLMLLPVSLAIITWIIHSRIAMQLMTERKSNSGLDLILGRKYDDNIRKELTRSCMGTRVIGDGSIDSPKATTAYAIHQRRGG